MHICGSSLVLLTTLVIGSAAAPLPQQGVTDERFSGMHFGQGLGIFGNLFGGGGGGYNSPLSSIFGNAMNFNSAIQGYNCGALCGIDLRRCRWACQPDPWQFRCTACMGVRWDTCRGCMMYPSIGGVWTQN